MRTRRYVGMLLVTLFVIFTTFAFTVASDDRPVLGLDLQGGISVVKFPEEGQDLSTLDTAAEIIRSRVDAVGIAEPEVSRQGNTVVIDLPGVKDRDRALELIGQTAELRFRLVQSQLPWQLEIPETTTTSSGATTTTVAGATTTSAAPAETATTIEGESAGVTIDTEPIAATRPAQEGSTTTVAPESATTVAGETGTTVAGATTTTVSPVIPEAGDDCKSLVATREENTAEATVWLPSRDDSVEKDDNSEPDLCYLLTSALLTGREVKTAKAEYNQQDGSWVVNITFKSDKFANEVAAPNVGQQLAIELDGVVQSAATINEGITGRDVQISGKFTKSEAKNLALVLKYGSLPLEFDENEETVSSVSPTLGKDQLHAGIVSGLIGIGLVALYMIFYYRLLGLVVCFGLGLTGIIFFTLVTYMSTSRGLTLTLAGVTGLIVSVGVTVDSYVVYFERLKDEIRTGKTLRSSLDTGFTRAFRTIVAADLVSLLGAVVLYYLSEGGVKNFALFLGLSVLIDLGISYFVMHPLVALMSRRPALVQMRGIGIAAGLDTPELRT